MAAHLSENDAKLMRDAVFQREEEGCKRENEIPGIKVSHLQEDAKDIEKFVKKNPVSEKSQLHHQPIKNVMILSGAEEKKWARLSRIYIVKKDWSEFMTQKIVPYLYQNYRIL